MQVAALLADLKSLSACDHTAAIALVNVHKNSSTSDPHTAASLTKRASISEVSDPDLQRAQDLVSLHYGVKVKYQKTGLDSGLLQDRRDVDAVLSSLGRQQH